VQCDAYTFALFAESDTRRELRVPFKIVPEFLLFDRIWWKDFACGGIILARMEIIGLFLWSGDFSTIQGCFHNIESQDGC
jgi:hypothetical protein